MIVLDYNDNTGIEMGLESYKQGNLIFIISYTIFSSL